MVLWQKEIAVGQSGTEILTERLESLPPVLVVIGRRRSEVGCTKKCLSRHCYRGRMRASHKESFPSLGSTFWVRIEGCDKDRPYRWVSTGVGGDPVFEGRQL